MRVILADDATLIRTGIARLLADRGIEIVAEAADGEALLRAVSRNPPDAVVLDIRMPPTFTDEGLRAADQIRRTNPDVALLVLSQYVEAEYAMRLLEQESTRVGYLLKDRVADVDAFIATLERVVNGGSVIDPSLIAELVAAPRREDPLAALTSREREVLQLVAEGRTDRGIAEALFVTRKTVEAHVRSIFSRLDLPAAATENRRVHAVLKYLAAPPSSQRPGATSWPREQ
jgi:DNA-binding NarL/FixJ family response regulator